ncbi:thiopurine S-methyltransferase [Simiduia agarivorans]|uniref:Thiopurine S-methyltransferase n=1 Tax=Simiduia agarivorans (strain DSM 21679 / JCM 13881 / BCRC 17597 / SA1) TaxID=1117647 RepID=K4KYW6_SIMAS|nr:thiopurine S-methyltransferase [Simiduia agarivorans]AFU99127.1 Thiopurine S-methyltransferase [Simiduia agarivorans SA1 = DSM 21679]
MEQAFWQSRWQKNEIGFHESAPNALLVNQFQSLGLQPGARVFVPLCGKSVDMLWLCQQGVDVVGCELSALAVEQFFREQEVTPAVHQQDGFTRYSVAGLTVWQGDFFSLNAAMIGPVDAVYDRAALIALPPAMRETYARQLLAITGAARQLLITLIYDQSVMEGPPFSVDQAEVCRLYEASMTCEPLMSGPLAGGLKGKVDATEAVWLLTAKTSMGI